MKEKGCGIVGLEYEQVPTEETYRQAADFLKESGVDYPNVLMPSTEELDAVKGFPTSFFVDKEGNVLCPGLGGPQVDMYEVVLDSLLSGETPAEPESAASEGDAVAAVYTVVVTDGDAGVEGVNLQFCDDTSCRIDETDENGVVKLDGKAGTDYEVHVIDVPDGYAADDTVYHFQGESTLTITLQKEG